MHKQLILTIGISLALCSCTGVIPTSVVAQCSCGDCSGGYSGENLDAGSIFESNVGTGQSTNYPTCSDGLCPQVYCPAVRCGPYVSVFGGWSTVDSFSFSGTENRQTETIRPPLGSMDPVLYQTTSIIEERSILTGAGGAGGIAIGRQFHAQGRAELEFAYRQNNFEGLRRQQFTDTFTSTDPNANPVFDDLLLTDIISEPAVGNMQTYSMMANFLYDFSPRSLGRYNLYGGGGIGGISVSGTATSATNVYDVSDATFAYQIIGGVTRCVTQKVDCFVDYRYMGGSAITITDVTNGLSLGAFDLSSNNIYFGLRFRR